MARKERNSNTERQKRWRKTDAGKRNRALIARRRRAKQKLINAHVLAGTAPKCSVCRFESRNPAHFHASLDDDSLICSACRIDRVHDSENADAE